LAIDASYRVRNAVPSTHPLDPFQTQAKTALAGRIEARRKAGNPYSQTCVDLISDYLTGTEEVVKGVREVAGRI
jgi:hypothetical protein